MLNTLNTPYLTIAAFALLIGLAIASEPYGHTYSEKDRAAMNALIAKVTAPQTTHDKIVYLFGEQ